MIDVNDKVYLGQHLHQLTRAELRSLHGVLEIEWAFDDCGPAVVALMELVAQEIWRRKKPAEDMTLLDRDRRVLRWGNEDWEQIIKPILLGEGIRIREFHEPSS